MRKYCDETRLNLEREEWGAIDVDFRAGLPLRKARVLLRLSKAELRLAVREGRLLAIQLVRGKFRPGKDGRGFQRVWWTNIRYPAWQFERPVAVSLPKILRSLLSRHHSSDPSGKFNFLQFYRSVRAFLFKENHYFEGRRPIDLLRLGGQEAPGELSGSISHIPTSEPRGDSGFFVPSWRSHCSSICPRGKCSARNPRFLNGLRPISTRETLAPFPDPFVRSS